jgi:hypothetical protein
MLIPIGTREDTTNNEIVYIDPDRHSSCFGMTGVGKSTYLAALEEHSIRQGLGSMVIDPHGGIVDSALKRVPKSRTKDVILVNAQKDRVAGINIFEGDTSQDEKVAAVVDTFVKIFGSSFMFSSENVMRWACYAVLEGVQSPTLMDVKRFLKDKKFMKKVLSRVTNPNVLAEFEGYDTKDWERKRVEQIAPVLNKLDQFLAHSLIRCLVGQRGKGVDFKQVLDRKQILLINLEGLGNRGAEMVGGFAFSQLFFASQKRKDRKSIHTVVIDEAQKFISSPIDFVLAESRKFGLSLHLGTQIISALPLNIRESIFGNVATTAVYRVGGVDAEILIKELSTNQPAYRLQDLPDYRAFVRYLIYSQQKGAKHPVGPFLTRMNPPSDPKGDEQKRDVVIRESLKWFGRDREFILKKIDEELRSPS